MKPDEEEGPSVFSGPLEDLEEAPPPEPEPAELEEARTRERRPFWLKVLYLLAVLCLILAGVIVYAVLQPGQTPPTGSQVITQEAPVPNLRERLESLERQIEEIGRRLDALERRSAR